MEPHLDYHMKLLESTPLRNSSITSWRNTEKYFWKNHGKKSCSYSRLNLRSNPWGNPATNSQVAEEISGVILKILEGFPQRTPGEIPVRYF